MCNGVLFRSAKIRHFMFTAKHLMNKFNKKHSMCVACFIFLCKSIRIV